MTAGSSTRGYPHCDAAKRALGTATNHLQIAFAAALFSNIIERTVRNPLAGVLFSRTHSRSTSRALAGSSGSNREVVDSSSPSVTRGHIAVIPDASGAQPLLPILETLGHTHSLCDETSLEGVVRTLHPEALFVGDLTVRLEVIVDAYPWLPVVVVGSAGDLDRPTLFDALHRGAADVLELPCSGVDVDEMLDRLRRRRELRRSHDNEQINLHLRELEKDQRAGRYIQMGMLPPNPMAIDAYRLRHRIQPSLMLSGDFVDYFQITDRYFACYVADVSGHGASSAFVTVLLKNFSRRIRREYRSSMLRNPGEILQALNAELLDQQIDKHVAIWLAVFDVQEHSATIVNAGHFPPAILITQGKARFLELSGKPVGLFANVEYQHETVHLDIDDQMVVYSDGVLELLSNASLAEKEARLLAAADRDFDSFDELWAALDISSAPGPDDVSCLVVTREA